MKFRKENDLDDILKDSSCFDENRKDRIIIKSCKSKFNQPSIVLITCKLKKNMSEEKFEKFMKYVLFVMETGISESLPDEEKMIMIIDMKDFGLANMVLDQFRAIHSTLDKYYPNTMQATYVIDAPFIFSATYAVIKPWLDTVTQEKIKFIKRSDLTEYFDFESLPDEVKIKT